MAAMSRGSRPPLLRFCRDNGLSLALLVLTCLSLVGQAVSGQWSYASSRSAAHLTLVGFPAYLGTGTFLDGLFSNWQAAVLQLAVLISFGAVLRQKGATHSLQPDEDKAKKETGDRQRHGWLFRHSLGLAFVALFVLTFVAHIFTGAWKYNEDQQLQHLPPIGVPAYLGSSSFWFSVFQCWEAEFAALGLYILFSIFLRHEDSPESKPVEASDEQTGGANE